MTEMKATEAEDERRKRFHEEAVRSFTESAHPFEDGARSFLNHIESCGNISLMPPGCLCLPDDEYKALKYSTEAIRPAFDDLAKWFIEPLREKRPDMVEYGYEKLWVLIGAAFRVGTHGTVTEGAKNFYKPQIAAEMRNSQAELARQEKKRQEAPRQEALKTAIKALVDPAALVDSEKFAESIREAAKARLPSRKDNWPSTRTIRRAIKAILEECRERQGHS